MTRFLQHDAALSRRLALPPNHPRWRLAEQAAHLGDGPRVFGGLGLVYLLGRAFDWPGARAMVLLTLAALVAAALVVFAVKYTLRRERPRDPTGFVTISYDKYSFPSGHSARMSALAGACLPFIPMLGAALLALAATVALARVMVGVHYLADVIAGYAIGLGVALLVAWAWTTF